MVADPTEPMLSQAPRTTTVKSRKILDGVPDECKSVSRDNDALSTTTTSSTTGPDGKEDTDSTDLAATAEIPTTDSEKSQMQESQLDECSGSDDDSQTYRSLPFDRVGLVGREKEIYILKDLVRRLPLRINCVGHAAATDDAASITAVTEQARSVAPVPLRSQTRTLVLLSGQSGSGKSALIQHVKQSALATGVDPAGSVVGHGRSVAYDGLFVSGKCELSSMREGVPYSGICSAMAELCQQIIARSTASNVGSGRNSVEEHSHKDRTLLSALADRLSLAEVELLSNAVPGIEGAVRLYQEQQQQQRPSPACSHGAAHPASSSASVSSLRSNGMNSFAASHFSVDPEGGFVGYREHVDKLKYALRRFMQILCNHCPVVIAVDDLQWADGASLALLQSWLLDVKNTSLTVIGAYRPNMLEGNQGFKSTLTSLEEFKRERSIRIVRLPVNDLSIDQVATFLARLFLASHGPSSSEEAVRPTDHPDVSGLATIVHDKTGGNVFFMRQFLQSLVRLGLIEKRKRDGRLSKRVRSCAYTWDVAAIRASAVPIADNIIDLMKSKLSQTSVAHSVLPIAACLGATFSFANISIVMRGLCIHSDHSRFFRRVFKINSFVMDTDIREMLIQCRREGLVEEFGDDSRTSDKKLSMSSTSTFGSRRKKCSGSRHALYCFVHDKIQEAALALVADPRDLSELKYRVGEILLYGLREEELEEKIFTVANLINTRSDLVPDYTKADRRMKIAMLNYRAGLKAASCSAFRLATDYFDTAIKLLPENHWKTAFRRTLELYSSAAESCLVTSDFDKARQYCMVIIKQDCEVVCKLRAYFVLMDICVHEAHREEGLDAVHVCQSLLSQLGCKFPKSRLGRTFYTIRGMIAVKACARRFNEGFLDSLPQLTDERDDAIMATLDQFLKVSYLTKPELMPVVILKNMKRTIKYGMSIQSAPAFAFQGLIIGFVMGDFDAGDRCGQVALDMLKSSDDHRYDSKTLSSVHSLVRHWKHPLEDSIEPFLEAYRLGMSCGDMDSATWSIFSHLNLSFMTGRAALDKLDSDLSTYTKTMQDFHQNMQYEAAMVLWQRILNLRGASKHRIKLIGDAYDERNAVVHVRNGLSDLLVLSGKLAKIDLCSFFGEFMTGAKIIHELFNEMLKKMPGSNSLGYNIFHGGLCCFYVARESKDRVYARTARKCLSKLKQWIKQGCPNSPHQVALLDAEDMLLQGKEDRARSLYEKSIRLAKKRRFVQDEALANEKLAEFCRGIGEMGDALVHLDEATHLYKRWGADKKVELLNEERQRWRQR